MLSELLHFLHQVAGPNPATFFSLFVVWEQGCLWITGMWNYSLFLAKLTGIFILLRLASSTLESAPSQSHSPTEPLSCTAAVPKCTKVPSNHSVGPKMRPQRAGTCPQIHYQQRTGEAGHWWCLPLIPGFGRQRQKDL